MKNDERIEVPCDYGTLVLDTKLGHGQYVGFAHKYYYAHIYGRSYLSQSRVGPIDRRAAKRIIKELSEWIAQKKPSDRQVRAMEALSR